MVLVTSRLGFEGCILVLIASVPGLCILFTFSIILKLKYCDKWEKGVAQMGKMMVIFGYLSILLLEI